MPTIALCTGSHRLYSRRPSLSFRFRICSCFPPFSIALHNSQKYKRKRTSAPAGHTRDTGESVAMHQNFRILLNISPTITPSETSNYLQFYSLSMHNVYVYVYIVWKKEKVPKNLDAQKLCTRLFSNSLPQDVTCN